jgi:hypothetical protein
MKLQYIVKVVTATGTSEIYLATLAAVKREIAALRRTNKNAQITYTKGAA